MNDLGYAFNSGHGVPQSDTMAARLYRQAADKGQARAQCNLGRCFAAGQGVPCDDDAAVAWFCKAAAQGHKGAKAELRERRLLPRP